MGPHRLKPSGSWDGRSSRDESLGPVLPPKFHFKQAAGPLPLTWPGVPPTGSSGGASLFCLQAWLWGASHQGGDSGDRAWRAKTVRRPRPGRLATMQDSNFLLSALQPEAGVCSLALPSDLQLDRRGPEAEQLRAARVQEQVRARLLQLGQQPRHNGATEPGGAAEASRGRQYGKVGNGLQGLGRPQQKRQAGVAEGRGRSRLWSSAPDSPGPALSHCPTSSGVGSSSGWSIPAPSRNSRLPGIPPGWTHLSPGP